MLMSTWYILFIEFSHDTTFWYILKKIGIRPKDFNPMTTWSLICDYLKSNYHFWALASRVRPVHGELFIHGSGTHLVWSIRVLYAHGNLSEDYSTLRFLGKPWKSCHVLSSITTSVVDDPMHLLNLLFQELSKLRTWWKRIILLVSYKWLSRGCLFSLYVTLYCCTSGLQLAHESVLRCSMQHLKTAFGTSLRASTMKFKLLNLKRWTWKWLETVLNEHSLFI